MFKAFGKKSIESQNDSRLSESRQQIIKVDLEKTLFFHCIVHLLSSAGTNIQFRDDTILIGEVEIRAKSDGHQLQGFKTTHIDSSIICKL